MDKPRRKRIKGKCRRRGKERRGEEERTEGPKGGERREIGKEERRKTKQESEKTGKRAGQEEEKR